MQRSPEDFDRLRRLLALKRYERPPAGCLDEIRHAVLEELRRTASVPARPEPRFGAWWWALKEALAPRPLWAGALSVAVCAVIVGAVLQAERVHLPLGLEGTGTPTPASLTPTPWLQVSAPVGGAFPETRSFVADTNLPSAVGPSLGPLMPHTLFHPPMLDVQRASSAPPVQGPYERWRP